jgi:hypothetical protein
MGVVLRGETVDSKALSGGPTSVTVTDSPPSPRITGSGDERVRTLRCVSGLPDTRNLDDIGDENPDGTPDKGVGADAGCWIKLPAG